MNEETSSNEYSHSDELGLGLFVVPAAAVASVLLAIIYSYAVVYSPFVGYLSFAITALLIAGIGYSIYALALAAKCRNLFFLRLVGVACGVLAFYVSWAAFEYVLVSRFEDDVAWTLTDLLQTPTVVWQIAVDISVDGWYSVYGYTPSGALL